MRFRYLILLLVLVVTAGVRASNSRHRRVAETINHYVIGGGGLHRASSAGNLMSATAGQTATTTISSSKNSLVSGFWNPGATGFVGPITVTLPNASSRWEIGSIRDIAWEAPASITDVHIELSRDGGTSWETLYSSTPNDSSETWSVVMPRSDRCVIRASDVLDEMSNGVSEEFEITPKRFARLVRGTTQPGGTEQTAYRLVSVPADLDDPSPNSVLSDDLGQYDRKEWRFFDYSQKGYSEFGATRNFEPGRAFFLIVRSSGRTIDTDDGVIVADSVVSLALDSGWNFIANPYNFSIPVEALSHNTDLRTYVRGWSDPKTDPVESLEPWEGYALYSSLSTVMTFRPSAPSSVAAPRWTASLDGGWSLRIEARCQDASDKGNYAGVAVSAANDWDKRDFRQPPPIGEYVSVYFPHGDWGLNSGKFDGDFRSTGRDGHVWRLEARSNVIDEVTLRFDGVAEVPPEFDVWLVYDLLGQKQNLRDRSVYTFENLDSKQIHYFRIIVGNETFTTQRLEELGTDTPRYSLYNNFPNPFRTSTAIRYTISKSERVTLRVFNVRGQEVRTLLVDAPKEAGSHFEYWNGLNNSGRRVGSGLYLYQLKAGRFVYTKKMTLVK